MTGMIDKFADGQTGIPFAASRILPSITSWTKHKADVLLRRQINTLTIKCILRMKEKSQKRVYEQIQSATYFAKMLL